MEAKLNFTCILKIPPILSKSTILQKNYFYWYFKLSFDPFITWFTDDVLMRTLIIQSCFGITTTVLGAGTPCNVSNFYLLICFSYTSLNDAVSQAIRRRIIRLVHNEIQSFFSWTRTWRQIKSLPVLTPPPTPSVKIILHLGFCCQRFR
jgi:hypothetical protein